MWLVGGVSPWVWLVGGSSPWVWLVGGVSPLVGIVSRWSPRVGVVSGWSSWVGVVGRWSPLIMVVSGLSHWMVWDLYIRLCECLLWWRYALGIIDDFVGQNSHVVSVNVLPSQSRHTSQQVARRVDISQRTPSSAV